MKKLILGSACMAALLVGCGGGDKDAVVEPQAQPIAWQDTVFYLNNLKGGLQGFDVNGYTESGQLTLVETYTVKDGVNSLTSTLIYENGKPVYGKDLEGDKVVGTDVFTYNEAGEVVEEVQSTFDQQRGKILPSVKYVYTYDEKGNLTKIVESDYENLKYKVAYEWTYSYDEQNRLQNRMDYSYDTGDRRQSCSYLYQYDENNRIKQMDYNYYDLKTNKLRHDAKTIYEYNAAGQQTTATMYRHKATQKREEILSRLFTREYNAAGQITYDGVQRWDKNGNNGKGTWAPSTNSTTFTYDEQGRQTEKNSFMQTGKGLRQLTEKTVYGAPADKVVPTPAAPAATAKPVVNLQDKNKTSRDED